MIFPASFPAYAQACYSGQASYNTLKRLVIHLLNWLTICFCTDNKNSNSSCSILTIEKAVFTVKYNQQKITVKIAQVKNNQDFLSYLPIVIFEDFFQKRQQGIALELLEKQLMEFFNLSILLSIAISAFVIVYLSFRKKYYLQNLTQDSLKSWQKLDAELKQIKSQQTTLLDIIHLTKLQDKQINFVDSSSLFKNLSKMQQNELKRTTYLEKKSDKDEQLINLNRHEGIEQPLVYKEEKMTFLKTINTEVFNEENLINEAAIVRDISNCQLTEEELQQSEARFQEVANREALINRLARQIRNSLDLETILATAVVEIRNLLQLERCVFAWYQADIIHPHWEIVQEAKNVELPSFINNCISVVEIVSLTTKLCAREIIGVVDTNNLSDPVERDFFRSLGYSTVLLMPIHTQSGEIGIVSCNHSSRTRIWSEREVELLAAVADQLAIAIDQAELYKQSRLAAAKAQEQATIFEQTLHQLQQTQAQLIQSEKMSSLGQLVAGVAHEINNPINFISGNLSYASEYGQHLLNLVELYTKYYPNPVEEIQREAEKIDLNFIKEDLPKTISSMTKGAERIRQTVLSLRSFSRLDEAEMKQVDIHEGIDNTLLILTHRLNNKNPDYPKIQIVKDYGQLPLVQCYAGLLNQVFMNVLSNAVDAIDEYRKFRTKHQVNYSGTILISTQVFNSNQVIILIGDNGLGMTKEVCHRIFDPFFTTKPIGTATGLGMSITYKIIVEQHRGELQCISAPDKGTAFLIQIPIRQSSRN